MRLYTADPDTGVARKGSDTYTEINLATIDDEHAAYATLLMTPEALCEGGTADEILPDACSHDIHARAREPKELVLYPGCRHGLDECRDALDRDLTGWIERVAAGS